MLENGSDRGVVHDTLPQSATSLFGHAEKKKGRPVRAAPIVLGLIILRTNRKSRLFRTVFAGENGPVSTITR